MLKIPTFIIGGLLILTGIVGYLLQDQGVSLKLKGPLAEDAQVILSDGNQSHELDLGFPSSDSAGEHAYWAIYNLNLNHAKDASQGNYAVDKGGANYEKKSFWYASSKGDTMKALKQESANFQGAGNEEQVEINWSTVDTNSSRIRFIFKDQVGAAGPVTLQMNNWKNVDITPTPKPNGKIKFKRSWTAFIPGIIGIILILLVLLADKMPKCQKHFMHVAALLGLFCFFTVAKQVMGAVTEMSWLKEEPYMIIHVSSLKPTTMLLTAGLLLIFVILCIVSFIEARKNRITEEKKAPKKSSSLSSTSGDKDNGTEDKRDSSKETDSEKNKEKSKDSKKSTDARGEDNDSGDKKDSSKVVESEMNKEKPKDSRKSTDAMKTSKTDSTSTNPKAGSSASPEKKEGSEKEKSNETKSNSPLEKPASRQSSTKSAPSKETFYKSKIPSDKTEDKKEETDSSKKE